MNTVALLPAEDRLADWRADYQAMRSMYFKETTGFDGLVQQLRVIEQSLTRL